MLIWQKRYESKRYAGGRLRQHTPAGQRQNGCLQIRSTLLWESISLIQFLWRSRLHISKDPHFNVANKLGKRIWRITDCAYDKGDKIDCYIG